MEQELEHAHENEMHLDGASVEYIEDYIHKVQELLRLQFWDIFLASQPADEGNNASINPPLGRRVAGVRVANGWPANDESPHITILHELLHLVHHDMDSWALTFVSGSDALSDREKDIFIAQFKLEIERMVDGLSYIMAPLLPKWNPEGVV